MRRESSPRESQCTWVPGSAAARASISGSVSSLIAATTTVRPWARAASRRRKGKRPLPAIRPSLGILVYFSARGVFAKDRSQELWLGQLAVGKSELRFLPGFVVICGLLQLSI